MSEPITLERPHIPVEFVTDLVREGGMETMTQALYWGNSTDPNMIRMAEICIWANELKAHADQHGGMVTTAVNRCLVKEMLEAFDVMRELGALS